MKTEVRKVGIAKTEKGREETRGKRTEKGKEKTKERKEDKSKKSSRRMGNLE